MGIIHQHNKKNGKTLVYETYTEIDPETGKKRTKKKYLGTEENGVLIPSSGKRGRKPSIPGTAKPEDLDPGPEEIAAVEAKLARRMAEQKELIAQIEMLTKQIEAFQEAMGSMLAAFSQSLEDDAAQHIDKE